MASVTGIVDAFNFRVPGRRWQLFEVCDLRWVPDFIKHCCQNTLTAHWTKRLPILQWQSPATLAADILLKALNGIEDIDTSDWTVIDFCSGAGGPTPTLELCVNQARRARGKKPIPFRLSDIYPNLDAWVEHAGRSDYLSFIPQPVDAGNPPFSVISTTTAGDKAAAFNQGYRSNGHKVFRLFCLSFHHFDDETAKEVLRSTLETSDAFAIVELQERTLGSLLLMVLEFWLLLLITVFWFWHSELHLLFTYGMPLLPAIHSFDGAVSCLRTRTFEEIMQLVESLPQRSGGTVKRGTWEFSHLRVLHTWPVGYMNVTFGKKVGLGR